MAKKGIYKIVFMQLGEIYEIYAMSIYQSDMYGFIEIEDHIFDQNSQIVVDTSEEKLKNEFKGVQRSYIPMSCICLLYTSPSPRDVEESRMPSSA